jgi:hypothetical protein
MRVILNEWKQDFGYIWPRDFSVSRFNSLKPSGKYSPALLISKTTVFIYGYLMFLIVNRDYFIKHH